uniref:Semaphorin-4F-like n=1 Tax=Pundamilia nyererei TaxID=303518 RepID=A0A3B4H0S3_9CICH
IIWDVSDDKRKSCEGKGKTEGDCRNYIRLLEFLGDGRIYVCGTYAFDPQCAFLLQNATTFTLEEVDGVVRMESGKGKCPFEPSQHYTAIMAGLLYTAATSNFLGTLFDISRATGPEQERIRTERSINWLSFVSSAFIEQSAGNPTGDDDKIYFFFNEVAKEYDFYTKVKVPRVARVCKSDVGGMKTLQRRWTTFLKAQLVCEDKPSGQRYNVLTDVFTMQHIPGDPSSTHFYGLFTSQEQVDLSAVCVFSLSDISKVLDGPFKELKKSCDNWINHEPIPSPRPGQCLNSALKAEGFESSLKLPDKVLTFVRDHPLMENSVTAASLLVRKGISYTKLAVNLKDGSEEQRAAVLYLGTRGELHQVAVVGQNVTLLQETTLFTSQEPVNNILLHKGHALVGSPLSLARVQAEGCALYRSCEVCARARGLGCVWLRLLLSCVQLSPRPCSWEYPPHRHTRQHNSDLEVVVTDDNLGNYVCTCQNSLSSGKGRDLLGSSATPQSPSSSSLFSDGFRMAEKRNGTATSTTTTTLLSNHGNGGHSYSDTLISSNSSNGHGNSLYANCNTSGSGKRLGPEFLSPDMLDRRTGERERVRSEGGERESGEAEEVEEGLRDGLGEGMKRLEEEISSFTMFKSPAPLARCEESSI